MRIKTGSPIDPSLFGFRSDGNFSPVTAIATDSREICPRDLFVALPGDKTDGAKYIEEAFARGAALVLSHRKNRDPRVLAVPDPLAVLHRAAALHIGQIPHRTVAITGSYGKTTLRVHLTSILSAACPVAFTEGNGNTDLALALTLLSASPDDKILIAELGMRGRGEISRLSKLVKPDIAVITAIGTSHLGLLGSKEAIREAKCEIADGMENTGCLFYPANDPALLRRVSALPVQCRSVSTDPAHPGTYTLSVLEKNGEGALVSLTGPEGGLPRVSLPGNDEPTLCSAAFCFAVCERLGVDRRILREGLSQIEPPPLRRQIERIGGVTVVLDCYNASPEPTEAALSSLQKYRNEGKRIFLILGEMLELGDQAPNLHRKIGQTAAALSPERLFCVGDLAREYGVGANEAGLPKDRITELSRDELPQLAAVLQKEMQPKDLLFVKGSRALALERIVLELKQAEI